MEILNVLGYTTLGIALLAFSIACLWAVIFISKEIWTLIKE